MVVPCHLSLAWGGFKCANLAPQNRSGSSSFHPHRGSRVVLGLTGIWGAGGHLALRWGHQRHWQNSDPTQGKVPRSHIPAGQWAPAGQAAFLSQCWAWLSGLTTRTNLRCSPRAVPYPLALLLEHPGPLTTYGPSGQEAESFPPS